MLISRRLTAIRSSFRSKIFVAFTLLSALISILLSTLYITSEIREKRAYLSANLKLVSEQLVESIRLPLYAENRAMLQQMAEKALQLPEIKAVVISSADNRRLVDLHAPDQPGPQSLLTETAQVFSSPLVSSVEHAISGRADTDRSLIGSVRLDRSTADLSQQIRQLILYSAGAALLFWLVVTSVFYLILRTFTDSFNELMLGLKRMQSGDYSSRIGIESIDEPGQAAQAANELSDRLLRRTEENQRLTQHLHATNRSLEMEIAERIQAEQQLRDSEQNLKFLMDVMPVGVSWHDSNGAVEYINSFFQDRFGYGREDLVSVDRFFSCFLPDPAQREQIVAAVHSAAEAAKKGSLEYPLLEAKIICKDGSSRHVIIKSTAERHRTILIFVDITEREELQNHLIKAQKLESIGTLAGGIAHNFNNALTGVMGYISLAAKHLDNPGKAADMLRNAERGSKRAAAMARQLLTFARGGAPIKKPLRIAGIIDASVSIALNGTSVRSIIEIPEQLCPILGDEDQLFQVFSNLGINAVQAMPDGGTLTIRAEEIVAESNFIGSSDPCRYVAISFSDTGIGIPEEHLSKIFDPYFTTNPSSSGLGLASVHSIVHRHGGRIRAESAVGNGTTFTLLLPAVEGTIAEIREQRDHTAVIPARKNAAILVMDDEEIIRNMAQVTLDFLGYQAQCCANGEEAVAAYCAAWQTEHRFAAVILDLTVACGMGGAEAAGRILEFDPDAVLIVSSGYAYDPVMAEHEKHGFRSAIIKPYSADDLGRTLANL